MAKAKKRTTAQRRAAAKEAWALRKAAGTAATAAVNATVEPTTGKAITTERHATHGSFAINAYISQGIKRLVFEGGGDMTDVQKEATDMIALKLSRIGSGHASFADHWVDIIGYAQLALEQIESGEEVS